MTAARCGSFAEAARQLKIVPSVVAKRISQLELHVGVRLFERTTRKLRLTLAGEKLQAGAASLLGGFEHVLDGVGRDEGKLEGHIRVMAPTSLTLAYLGGLFSEFLRQHDGITMEVALIDLSMNPAEQGYDMAISGRSATYDGVVDVPLCSARPIACAAPAYLRRVGDPGHPRELTEHACLAFKPSGTNWNFQSSRGAVVVEVRPRLAADDNWTLLRAAVGGLGIACLPAYIVHRALERGALQRVLENFPLQENWFKAYVPRRRQRVARVAALLSFLEERLAGEGWIEEAAAQLGPAADGA